VLATWVSRIPTIKQHLGLNAAQLGLALVGTPIGLIIAMRVVPGLVARHSSAVTTRGAAAAACICVVLLALAPSLLGLLALLALFGLMLGTFDISMNTQGVAIERGYERPIMAALHGAYSVGVLVGALGGSIAAHLQLSPLAHFSIAAAALMIVNALGTRALLPARADTDDEPTEKSISSGGDTAARRFLLALGVIAFCSLVAEGAVDDWSGVFLHEVHHASFSLAPLGTAACGAGMTAGRLLGDRFIARYGRQSMLWRSALLAAVGMSIAVLAPTLGIAIAGYAILGLGVATIVPIAFTLAGNVAGVAPAAALSFVTTIGYAGLFGSPSVIGLLAHTVGLRVALWLPAALLMLIVVMSPVLRSRTPSGEGGRSGV